MGLLTKQFIERSNEIKELAREKAYRDGDGLYLLARPNGSHSWVFRYSCNGIRDKITIGKYKDISITEARYKVFKYNHLLTKSKNPKIEKSKQQLQDDSLFCNVADKYFQTKHLTSSNPWKSDTYNQNFRLLNTFILPKLKHRNIQDIEPWEIANILEDHTPHNQRKMKSLLSSIFTLAIGKGYIKYNIVRDITTDRVCTKGFSFIDPIDDEESFRQLVKDINNYHGSEIIKNALKLAILLGLRPGNLIKLRWSQVDFNNRYIVIEAGEMKKARLFRQPLSNEASAILLEIKESSGNSEYVFRNRGKHINKDSLSKALRSMGYQNKQCTHGFRKSLRTYISNIRSNYNWCDDSIRMILSHKKNNVIDDIYDKNDFLTERAQMLQIWANYIDNQRDIF